MTDTVEIVERLPRKPRISTPGFWTPERVDELRGLLEVQGMSSTEAGAHFGKSRNAIIGVALRRNLKLRDKTHQQARRMDEIRRGERPGPRPGQQNPVHITRSNLPRARTTPAKAPAPKYVPPSALALFDAGLPQEQLRRVWELNDDQCRWPVSEDAVTYWFCARTIKGHRCYCPTHAGASRHPPRS